MSKQSSMPMTLSTAVLVIAFNRPEETRRLMAVLASVKPERLYIAVDGPRANTDEQARVAEVRRILSEVSWTCELNTLFHSDNHGCKYGPSTAIGWFFDQEAEGIILEDDCIPDVSFFTYCQWALNKYRNTPEIWHINGNNFGAKSSLYSEAVAYVAVAQVWGWASWADRWTAFELNPFYLRRQVAELGSADWRISSMARMIKRYHLDLLCEGLDAWDYQWQLQLLMRGTLAVSPHVNLVSNVGDGDFATHTRVDGRTRLPVSSFQLDDATRGDFSPELSRFYEARTGMRSLRQAVRFVFRELKQRCVTFTRSALRSALLKSATPIVVASSGRAGSTLLCDTIARAYVDKHLPLLSKVMPAFSLRLAYEFIDRLQDLPRSNAPILKTHDVFRADQPHHAKYIYIFGDAREAALSVAEMARKHGQIWVEEHIFHLAGKGGADALLQSDVLNFEQQLSSWSKASNTLLIHYDDLWDRQADIRCFLGLEITLPARKKRTAKQARGTIDEELFARLNGLCEQMRAYSLRR